MDSSSPPLNVGSKKSLKRPKSTGGKGRDIISNLPESIISHILSLLPTKDAVRTSALSTTWKYKWTSVSSLHFDYKLPYFRKRMSKQNFMNSVDRVLLHCTNPTIQNFYLVFPGPGYYDLSRLNAWISVVIRRKVQRLYIDCTEIHSGLVFVPLSLFSCNSLIELKIQMSCILRVPNSVCLSNLKILRLFHVWIRNLYCSHSTQLVLSFPVLKEFNSSFCRWIDVNIVDISAPALDCLTLELPEYHTAHTHASLCDCVFKIGAPSLTKFKYEGYLFEDFILASPPSNVEAVFEVSTAKINLDQMQEMGFRACRLLTKFTGLKCLTLCSAITEVLTHVEDLEAYLPVFDKLTDLKLSELTSSISLHRTMMALFQSSPNLECLIFNGGTFSWENNDDLALGIVPQCFLSHLQVVIYQNFDGMEPELSIVKFLLKNLKALQEMTISASLKLNSHGPETTKEEVKKQLLSFAKASSSHALIVFS